MRDKTELAAVKKMLERRSAVILPLTEAITEDAITAMDALTLSHGLQMADASNAATALRHGLPLLTGNARHFTAVPGLAVAPFAA